MRPPTLKRYRLFLRKWLLGQIWLARKRRSEIIIAISLTVFSGCTLKFLVEVCRVEPTISNILRWTLVTLSGFFLYRQGVTHDGRLFKQLWRYILRRMRKMTLSIATYTLLVALGVHYFAAWIVCSIVFGLYEFTASKKSVYGEGKAL